MSDSRKRLSGFQYKKKSKEKAEKEQEFLAKVPKLDNFFSKHGHLDKSELDQNDDPQAVASVTINRSICAEKSLSVKRSSECLVSASKDLPPPISYPHFSMNTPTELQKEYSKVIALDTALQNNESVDSVHHASASFISATPTLKIKKTDIQSVDPPVRPLSSLESLPSKKIVNHSDDFSDTTETRQSIDSQQCNLSSIIVSDDPADWIINDETRNVLLKRGVKQNLDIDYSSTKRHYTDRCRYLSKAVFHRRLQNGEIQSRAWLVYSKSKRAVFCAHCKLFEKKSPLTEGYNDWKNIYDRLKEHENSLEHKSASTSLLKRSTLQEQVDKSMIAQVENEIQYWRNVLRRIVATIKSLAQRGLPFRGSNEKFGTLHSGNYIMSLELIAEFDPFLATHIKTHGNKGSGSTSYLSSKICDEFIHLMAKQLVTKIINDVKAAKYYSISVDSMPDVSHVDQLTFIIRYVSPNGCPNERFLKFIPNCGHKAEELEIVVLKTLEDHDLDIKNCRGQSYDNASNMSGIYTGLQARIKRVNPLPEYVPCAAHSLNLVGKCAVESSPFVVRFFAAVQHLYNFFSASTHRWEILTSYLKSNNTVKTLCQTRWSAHYDACKTLSQSWHEILSALHEISENQCEKPATRSEALGLHSSFNCLENCFLSLVWVDILERINSVNKIVQSAGIELATVVELYQSLIKYTENIRENFDVYEAKAIEKCHIDSYGIDTSRLRKRKLPFEEQNHNENTFSGKNHMKINVFYMIIDRLRSDLVKRCKSYVELNGRFGFLTKLHNSTTNVVSRDACNLQKHYPEDIEDSIDIECQHLSAHLSSLDVAKISMAEMCKMFYDKQLLTLYPNVNIAIRMYLCMMASNCSGERTFSALRRTKDYLRSTITQNRLNALSILYIEAELSRQISYDDVINEFATQKARKVLL